MKAIRAVGFVFAVATMAAVVAAVPSSGQKKDATDDWDGGVLFMANCASCHGVSGTGDGPAAPAMRVRPPNLTRLAASNGNLFPSTRTQRIIDGRDVGAHGNPDMPVWGTAFKRTAGGPSEVEIKARIAAIVRYLESIQERKG